VTLVVVVVALQLKRDLSLKTEKYKKKLI